MTIGIIATLNSAMFSECLTNVLASKDQDTFTLDEIKSCYAEATVKLIRELEEAEESYEQEEKESEITQFGKTGLA